MCRIILDTKNLFAVLDDEVDQKHSHGFVVGDAQTTSDQTRSGNESDTSSSSDKDEHDQDEKLIENDLEDSECWLMAMPMNTHSLN